MSFRQGVLLRKPDIIAEKMILQRGMCKICEVEPATALDHCHKTRALRDLLCKSCNYGLGFFKDDIDLLKRAIDYIKRHEENPGEVIKFERRGNTKERDQKISEAVKRKFQDPAFAEKVRKGRDAYWAKWRASRR